MDTEQPEDDHERLSRLWTSWYGNGDPGAKSDLLLIKAKLDAISSGQRAIVTALIILFIFLAAHILITAAR